MSWEIDKLFAEGHRINNPLGIHIYTEPGIKGYKQGVYHLTEGYFKNLAYNINGNRDSIETLYTETILNFIPNINPFSNNNLNDPSNNLLNIYFSLCDNSYSQDFLM